MYQRVNMAKVPYKCRIPLVEYNVKLYRFIISSRLLKIISEILIPDWTRLSRRLRNTSKLRSFRQSTAGSDKTTHTWMIKVGFLTKSSMVQCKITKAIAIDPSITTGLTQPKISIAIMLCKRAALYPSLNQTINTTTDKLMCTRLIWHNILVFYNSN
jgi:hypothetical protein